MRRGGRCARLLAGALLALLPLAGHAATVYVDITNETGTEDGSLAFPYNTIREGVNNAAIGDKVQVAAGLYKETVLMRDGVSLLGTSGPTVTRIDGTGLGNPVVTFNGTRFSPILSGFTITGGSGDQSRDIGGVPVRIGGGILVLNSSSIITRNVITGNIIDNGYCLGGGVYVYSVVSTPQIVNNIIVDNVALSTNVAGSGQGGGIYVISKNGGVVIRGNRILSNRALDGGGVYIENIVNSTATIAANVIRNNEATDGGGVFLRDEDESATTVVNNVLVGNGHPTAGNRGGGIHASSQGTGAFSITHNTLANNALATGTGGAVWLDDSLSSGANLFANNVVADNAASLGGGVDHTAFFGGILSNIFHANTGGDLYDAGGSGAPLVDNLFVDPAFLSAGTGNYQPAPASPCIDSADDTYAPADDVEGFPRPFDGDGDLSATSDRGAYEYPAGETLGLLVRANESISWLTVPQQDRFHLYRGSLDRLRATGEYTQDTGTEPAAARFCDLLPAALPIPDSFTPAPGAVVFYLVSQAMGSWEGSLGEASSGLPRPNDHSCP